MTDTVSPVKILDNSHFFILAVLHKQFRGRSQQQLHCQFDITLEMLGALNAIQCYQPVSQQQLSDSLMGERSAVKRLVDNIIKRELVVVSRSDTNKKLRLLSLTPAGESMLTNANTVMRGLGEKFLSVLTKNEQDQLMSISRKLVLANCSKKDQFC